MKPRIHSPELASYLATVRDQLQARPINQTQLVAVLRQLLGFLSSPIGRTDINCKDTDLYFQLHDDNGFGWQHVPEALQLILDDIGGQLHDTITHPQIAESFESTPEQLLERLNSIETPANQAL